MAARTKRTYSLRPETVTRVRELAARYEDVYVGADNQAVVGHCATVFIALRATVVSEVLPGLHFLNSTWSRS